MRIEAAAPVPRAGRALAFCRDLVALTKPRITTLVLLTEAAGIWLAPEPVPPSRLLLSLAGTLLLVASANTLNMWWERDVDARMARTRNRPLPAGRMAPEIALAFGLALAFVSTPMLFLVNVATGLLGLVALISYVAVYTPLKRHTHLALLVGAVPGAIPPLLGWSTATGGVGLGGLLLFALLFLWQMPHFAAIAIFRVEDYARAGLQVVSVQHGERAARRTIAVYTLLLAAVSFLFVPFGFAGPRYAAVATVLDAALLAIVIRGLRAGGAFDGRRWAKQVFGFSIVYLTLLLAALLTDRAAPASAGGPLARLVERIHPRPPLPVLGHVPAFHLLDQRGAPFTADSMRGHVSVVDFIFTRCHASCPRLTGRMSELQTRLQRAGSDARLVSFSVDPENDTPEVLAAYAAHAHADPARWTFVTGPLDDVERAVVLGFKVSAAKVAAGAEDYQVVHGDWFVLVDPAGDIRGYYSTAEASDFDGLTADVAKLH